MGQVDKKPHKKI